MEKRKQQRKRRKVRCSTEPPLSLVCSQSPGDLTVPSPDLLNITWTWDARGPRRPKTIKRHPTVLASMRKRPNFRKPRLGVKAKHGLYGGSQCSSDQSSEYFDALPDQREAEKWDEDWPNELEYFTDADDGMSQVRLYEQRRLDTITNTYSHLYDGNASTRFCPNAREQSNYSETTGIYSLNSVGAKSQSRTSGSPSLPNASGQKSKSSPYLEAVAKVLHWTTRKTEETLFKPNEDSGAQRRHSLREEEKDFETLGRDVNLKANSSNTLPSRLLNRHEGELQPASALSTVAWTPREKRAQRDVRRFIKKIYKGMLDRKRKPDKFVTEISMRKDDMEKLALLDQDKSDLRKSNDACLSRKCSIPNDHNIPRRRRSNGWKTKYKKSTWNATEWYYADIPPQNQGTQDTSVSASDLRRNSSANSYINESPFSKRSNVPVRDKVEFFDIRSLSDENRDAASPGACSVVVTDSDIPDRSFVSELEDQIARKCEADDASMGRYPTSTPPPSPLLKKFLFPFRDTSLSRGSLSAGSDDSHSAAHSSDCEDGEKSDSASLMDRFRGLRKDMQKKISKVKSPRGAPYGSTDDGQLGLRVPDTRTRPTQAAVDAVTDLGGRVELRQRLNSGQHNSASPPPPAPYTGPFIGRAIALTDFQPSPYDVDLLKFNKGDVIDIISKSPSGQWRGCVDGRVGEFKFILVEEETERDRLHRRLRGQRSSPLEQFPHASVEALLRHFKLSHLLQMFILHGYETLDQFREVDEQDLDNLGIREPDTRAKLLAAVASILEYEQNSIVGHVSEASVTNNTSSSSRDSGCFTDQKAVSNSLAPDGEGCHADGRQSSPSTDNSSGYQGRGNYIIAHAGEVSSTLQEVPDTTLDSSSSTEEDLTSKEFKQHTNTKSSHSQQRKDLDIRSCDNGEPDSYRATPVFVRPGTPESSPQLRKKLQDDSDVVASARCSSDTGVSVQSSSSEAVQFQHGEG